MHYRNGRKALAGDRVFSLSGGEYGILYNTSSSSDMCNGRLASMRSNDPYISIKECLHIEDIRAAGQIRDTSSPAI
jgi:hypothetical protein